FINSLTALSAELEGRHYGGGVLELVPSEIEKLLLPLPSKAKISLKDLDKKVRTESAHGALEANSREVLGGLGLSATKQAIVFNGWKRLRNRRHRTSSEEEVSETV